MNDDSTTALSEGTIASLLEHARRMARACLAGDADRWTEPPTALADRAVTDLWRRPPSGFGSWATLRQLWWIRRAVLNDILDHARRRRRRPGRQVSLADLAAEPIDPDGMSPSTIAELQEALEALPEALEALDRAFPKLTPSPRSVFESWSLLSLSRSQLARMFDCTEDVARSRLNKARVFLMARAPTD